MKTYTYNYKNYEISLIYEKGRKDEIFGELINDDGINESNPYYVATAIADNKIAFLARGTSEQEAIKNLYINIVKIEAQEDYNTYVQSRKKELFHTIKAEAENDINFYLEHGYELDNLKKAFSDGEWLRNEEYQNQELVEEIDSQLNSLIANRDKI